MFDELINADDTPQETLEAANLTDVEAHYYSLIEKLALELRDGHTNDLEAANTRFSTAIKLGRFKSTKFCVLGAGGIGTWVVRSLVGMGALDLTVIDDDVVEIHNIGPQAYELPDLGKPKVLAMQQAMLRFRGVKIKAEQFRVSDIYEIRELCNGTPDVLITAVDNMGIRNELFNNFKSALNAASDSVLPKLYVDLRMSLGAFNQFVLPLMAMLENYLWPDAMTAYEREAVFADSEGVQEACTERALVYTGAAVAASTCAVIHWFNDTTITEDVLKKFLDVNSDLPHHWLSSFNSREWRDSNLQVFTPAIQKRITDLMQRYDALKDNLETLRKLSSSGDEYFIFDANSEVLAKQQPQSLEVLTSYTTVVYESEPTFSHDAYKHGPETVWLPVDMFDLQNEDRFCHVVGAFHDNWLAKDECRMFRKRKSAYGATNLRPISIWTIRPNSFGVKPDDFVFDTATDLWFKIVSIDPLNYSDEATEFITAEYTCAAYDIVNDPGVLTTATIEPAYTLGIRRREKICPYSIKKGHIVKIKNLGDLCGPENPRHHGLKEIAGKWCLVCEVAGIYRSEAAYVITQLGVDRYHLVTSLDINSAILSDVMHAEFLFGEEYDSWKKINTIVSRQLATYNATPGFPNVPLDNYKTVLGVDGPEVEGVLSVINPDRHRFSAACSAASRLVNVANINTDPPPRVLVMTKVTFGNSVTVCADYLAYPEIVNEVCDTPGIISFSIPEANDVVSFLRPYPFAPLAETAEPEEAPESVQADLSWEGVPIRPGDVIYVSGVTGPLTVESVNPDNPDAAITTTNRRVFRLESVRSVVPQ